MKKQKKIVRFFLIFGLFVLNTNIFSQNPNFYIYLCFGQSNMEGQGTIQTQDYSVDSRFQTFQALDCPNLSRVKETWYTADPPTCQCYSRLSPADYFGRTMVANLPDSITIGIINVSVGGCDIRLFDKDIYQDYDSTFTESWFIEKLEAYNWNPYQYLIDLALLAKQDGVIKGILLHQGETNTGDVMWPSYVKKIYIDILTDLSLYADSVPLLAGEVLSAPGNCCASMNTIINRLPDTIPTAYVISSNGCTGQEDGAHFDSKGYRKLGRRYGVQMLTLMGYEAAYTEPECGTVGENWKIKADLFASNGGYVTGVPGIENISQAPTDDASIIQMDFTLSKDTTYYVYGRFNNPSADSNSYWIKIDNDDFELFDDLTTSGWQWIELKSYELTAGEHTISVAIAEEGASLDKLVIKNSEISPVDVGEEAGNLCEPEFTPSDIKITHSNKKYSLEQNYPNPFVGNSSISFELPDNTYVSLKVFNMLGVEIAELAAKEYSSGRHTVKFNSEKFSAGNYWYTLKTDKFYATRKMTILEE